MRVELLQGTLDMLLLRALLFGPLHGHGIATRINRTSEDVIYVDLESMYPVILDRELEVYLGLGIEEQVEARVPLRLDTSAQRCSCAECRSHVAAPLFVILKESVASRKRGLPDV